VNGKIVVFFPGGIGVKRRFGVDDKFDQMPRTEEGNRKWPGCRKSIVTAGLRQGFTRASIDLVSSQQGKMKKKKKMNKSKRILQDKYPVFLFAFCWDLMAIVFANLHSWHLLGEKEEMRGNR
jgi:hypothetical protein